SAETYRMRDWRADVRVGGRWKVNVCTADGQSLPATGEFLEVDERRVVQTRRYEWEHPRLGTRDTTVTYRVEAVGGGGSRLTVRHDGFVGRAEAAEEHAAGWEHFLVWLEAYLRSTDVAPVDRR